MSQRSRPRTHVSHYWRCTDLVKMAAARPRTHGCDPERRFSSGGPSQAESAMRCKQALAEIVSLTLARNRRGLTSPMATAILRMRSPRSGTGRRSRTTTMGT